MKRLLCFFIIFVTHMALQCHPIDVNQSENSTNLIFASPVVNAGSSHFSPGNTTVATVPSVNVTVLFPTLNATDLVPTVHLNSSYYSDETDSLIVVAQDGNVLTSKALMKKCSFGFEGRLKNGTIDSVSLKYPATVVQKVVEFCNSGSIGYVGNDEDDLSDVGTKFGVKGLSAYLFKREGEEVRDQLAEAKERRERLEAANQEASSAKKNLITEAMLFQIFLICIPRFFV